MMAGFLSENLYYEKNNHFFKFVFIDFSHSDTGADRNEKDN